MFIAKCVISRRYFLANFSFININYLFFVVRLEWLTSCLSVCKHNFSQNRSPIPSDFLKCELKSSHFSRYEVGVPSSTLKTNRDRHLMSMTKMLRIIKEIKLLIEKFTFLVGMGWRRNHLSSNPTHDL